MNSLADLLDELLGFIEPYKTLLDTHNIQFITDQHWSNDAIITRDLRLELEHFLVEETNLIKYFNQLDSSNRKKWPHLDQLFNQVKLLKSKWNDSVLTDINKLFEKHNVAENVGSEFDKKFELMKKQNRFMNQKKVYEVDTMSIFVAKLCRHLQIRNIVDIGAGRAYLSTQLSSPVFESFNVIAIDSKEKYVESSINRLAVMKRKTTTFSTKSEESCADNFTTFNQFIQSSTKLNELIESQSSDKKDYFALVGLHSCGNLSNSIVNLYLDNQSNDLNKKCKLLFNVACCYNLLSEKYSCDNPNECEIDQSSKFPMSEYLNRKSYALGFNIRMIACHNFERTLDSLEDFRELNNSNLWYRCVLQDILESDLYKSSNSKIGRKLVKDKSVPERFTDYVRTAIQKLELDNQKISDVEILDYWNKNLNLKSKFNIYIQLKMILAPIIEHIILLDRLIYLYEFSQKSLTNNNKRFTHYLIKIFDPLMSPRCHALVSFYE